MIPMMYWIRQIPYLLQNHEKKLGQKFMSGFHMASIWSHLRLQQFSAGCRASDWVSAQLRQLKRNNKWTAACYHNDCVSVQLVQILAQRPKSWRSWADTQSLARQTAENCWSLIWLHMEAMWKPDLNFWPNFFSWFCKSSGFWLILYIMGIILSKRT